MKDKKTEILRHIYALYEKYVESFESACKKYCSDCCTANVTITSLEGLLVLQALDPAARAELAERIIDRRPAKRFQPKLTTNRFAEYCRQGSEPPEEAAYPWADACPLLESDACIIYQNRPFACRCMISARSCKNTGEAEIDPFVLTLNTVFLQFIEHLDENGFFGNLSDVLPGMTSRPEDEFREFPAIPTSRIPALMVPPEHRLKIGPVLAAIGDIMDRSQGMDA